MHHCERVRAKGHAARTAHLLWCALLLSGACACSYTCGVNSRNAAGSTAAGATSQAASTALPRSEGAIRPLGAVTPVPGQLQVRSSPATLPCQHGSLTLTMRADGTDPRQLCAHLGTRITMHLPQFAGGPWQPADLTGDPIGSLSTTRDGSGTVLRLAATAAGTAHISTQTDPGVAAAVPTRSWQLTIIAIP